MGIRFNKSDFVEIFYSFIFINETSGTENSDYKNTKLQEVTTTGITLIVPTKSCQKGHTLTVLMFKGRRPSIPKKIPKSAQGEGIYFSAVVKVLSKDIIETDKENSLVELKFSQFDNYRWDDIVQEFNDRRKEINATLNKTKVIEK